MEVPIFLVDAFTTSCFGGNPAAICLLPAAASGATYSDLLLQSVAAEMNLSETAFVQPLQQPRADGGDPLSAFREGRHFGLRWFTPTNEVALCGHATIAAAAVLLRHPQLHPPRPAAAHGAAGASAAAAAAATTLTFETLSGALGATANPDGSIALDFPLNAPVQLPWPVAPAATTATNSSSPSPAAPRLEPWVPQVVARVLEGSACGAGHVAALWYSAATKKLLVVLDDGAAGRAELETLAPDSAALLAVKQTGSGGGETAMPVSGVSVTLRAAVGSEADFYSRYFAPWNGIDEDPVNGSSHTVLAAYWARRLRKTALRATQCSKRGGELLLRVPNPTDGGGWAAGARVSIAGHAAFVLAGTLQLPRHMLQQQQQQQQQQQHAKL